MTALNVPKIFVINLKARQDRLISITHELENLGLFDQSEIIEGIINISHKTGTAGIALSYKKCIELAKERNYENVMILQDDCKFVVDRATFIERINTFIQSELNWSGLWFGSFYSACFETPEQNYAKATKFNQDTGVVFNQEYYDLFIQYFDYCATKYIETGEDKYNIDQLFWHLNDKEEVFLPLKNNVYVVKQRLCGQADNYSNRMFDTYYGGIGVKL